MKRRPWKPEEVDVLRRNYAEMRLVDLGAMLNRTAKSVYLCALKEGLTASVPRFSAQDKSRVKALARKGLCNRCIGREIGHSRKAVRLWRSRLGCAPVGSRGPSDKCNECKKRVRAKTQEQCRRAGVGSLAEVRSLVFATFAQQYGWPAGIPARCVQILELLSVHGAMTRRQLWERMGFVWTTSRKAFKGRKGLMGCSTIAHLIRLGLVVSLGRPVQARPVCQGGNVTLYSLTKFAINLKEQYEQHGQQQTEKASVGQSRKSSRKDAERSREKAGCATRRSAGSVRSR